MIELKDLFPIEMQDYMFAVPGQDPLSETQFDYNTSSWQYPTSSYDQNDYKQNSNFYPQPLLVPQIDAYNNIPTENMLQQQPNIIDYPPYLATVLPNATLHNKLLATLPRHTLQSAERLLSNKRQPQHMTESLPNNRDQHYFNTFQLDSTNLPATNTNYATQSDEKPLQCSNCDTRTTPLWRRSTNDKVLCNACGL